MREQIKEGIELLVGGAIFALFLYAAFAGVLAP